MQIQVPESEYRSISEYGEGHGTADYAKPSMWPTNTEGANSNILTFQLLSPVKADVVRDIIWIPLSLRAKSRLIVQTVYSLSSLAFLTTIETRTYYHFHPLFKTSSVKMRSTAPSLLFGASSSLFAVARAVADASSTTAAQYFVRSLPGQPEGPLIKMHAGCVFPFFEASDQQIYPPNTSARYRF